jgi:hypothetical protein
MVDAGAPAFKIAAIASRDLHWAAQTMMGVAVRSCRSVIEIVDIIKQPQAMPSCAATIIIRKYQKD